MSSLHESSRGQNGLNPEFWELLCRALKRSHDLSKELSGWLQDQEFQNRADLASILVCAGYARPNGIQANGNVGLDICCDDPYQVHEPLGRLHPTARARLRQGPAVPVKCSLREVLESKGRNVDFSELTLERAKRSRSKELVK
jgi:hypothetical protein